MKKIPILFIILLLINSCNDEISVIVNQKPCSITGFVKLADSTTQLKLIQGKVIQTANCDENGIFLFEDVEPGQYRISISAPMRRTTIIEDIVVEDGMGYDLGEIVLSYIPYPLNKIVSSYNSYYSGRRINSVVTLSFVENMKEETLKNAVSITPTLDVETVEYEEGSTFSYLRINGRVKAGVTYKVRIDTTAQSVNGDNIEFPYEYTFTTDRFGIASYSYTPRDRGDTPVQIKFTSDLDNNALDFIEIEPSNIHVQKSISSNGRVLITPYVCWPNNTNIKVNVKKGFSDIYDNTFLSDTTISFLTEDLRITKTLPYEGDNYVDTTTNISLYFNNIIDEANIENAISISPSVYVEFHTSQRNGVTFVGLATGGFSSGTKYTVKVNKNLTDYYGNSLKEDFELKFVTRE